jgi:hypothetical protein
MDSFIINFAILIKALAGLAVAPFKWFTGRYPFATVTIVLGACAVLIPIKVISGQLGPKDFGVPLLIAIFGSAGMIAKMWPHNKEAAPATETSPDHNNWFHD